jgi:chromosome segregation ATPase
MASRINTDGENGADQMEQIFDVSEKNHELRLELHEIQEQDAETR